MDRMAAHYLYIGVLNTIAFISIPFLFKEVAIKDLFNNYPTMIYGGFIIFSSISLVNSINIIESLVELNQIITFFFSLVIVIFLSKAKLIKINFLLLLVILTLVFDLAISLINYVDIILTKGTKFEYTEIPYLLGLYGNRNILAITIAMRIPFVILFSIRLNKLTPYLLSFILVSLSFYTLILLSSRTSFLGVILSLIFIIGFLFYRLYFLKRTLFSNHKHLFFLYLAPLLLAYFISTKTISTTDRAAVTERVSAIVDTDDRSRQTRFRYYKQALETIKESPVFGIGLGNWKIYSIKKDSQNIRSYIIPYNVHNDILEFTAETGIIGGIFFLSFFIYLALFVLKDLNLNPKDLYLDNYSLFIMLPFILYFTDLNLNFPSTRPENLYLLLIYIAYVFSTKYQLDDKE
jgi:O-antigen ligase